MQFQQVEDTDGVRMSLNYIPATKDIAEQIIVPISLIYTPFKQVEDPVLLDYKPVKCKCNAILNPYCTIDMRSKTWTCPICSYKNQFSRAYADNIINGSMPPECIEQSTTVEYNFSSLGVFQNIFIIIIDLCIESSELTAIQTALIDSIKKLPGGTSIGLITYSRYVNVYELANTDAYKAVIFDGKENYGVDKIKALLDIASKSGTTNSATTPNTRQ